MRLSRLVSNDADFNSECTLLKQQFLDKKYPNSLIELAIQDVSLNRHNRHRPILIYGFNEPLKKAERHIPRFPLPISSDALTIKQSITSNWDILLAHHEVGKVVGSKPNFTYKRTHSLKTFLELNTNRPKGYPDKPQGTHPCTQCYCCQYILSTDRIAPRKDIEPIQLYGAYDCNTTHVVYYSKCLKCDAFYIGMTTRRLRDRISEH